MNVRRMQLCVLAALAGTSMALAQTASIRGSATTVQLTSTPIAPKATLDNGVSVGGPALDEITSTLVVQDLGVLTITTSNASDSFTLFVGEQGPGTVVLNAVPGVPDGTTYFDVTSIVISTLGGNDAVEVFASGETFPTVSIDLGAGQNEVVAQYNATVGAIAPVAQLSVLGGTGADKVTATINSDALGFTSAFNFMLGEGFNNTFVQWTSQSPGEDTLNLRVRGGGTVDTLGVAIEGLLSNPVLNLDAALGGGSDAVAVDAKSITLGEITANLAMDLGAGNDNATFNFAEATTSILSGSILGAGGADTIEITLNRDLAGAFTVDSGAGNDLIKVVAGNVIFGAPRLLAQGGNDIVELSGTADPFATPFSDGGPGFDAFKGVPVFINFEQIN